ncbi:MAG: hypothetical protein D6765_13505 [Bacteroidetes bacterium]|nr:MAG: hypothetical protein D6765_13505 [Bacteroidota bacterium]
MKRYFLKMSIALSIFLGAHLLVAHYAGGKIDFLYRHFTTPRQHSLIVGASRAAQGLLPEVFNEELADLGFQLPIYNFTFTIVHSPFGPSYLDLIQRKLAPDTRNGLFLVEVNPWLLTRDRTNTLDDPALFRENGLCTDNMRYVDWPVNYEYLLKNYRRAWGRIILDELENRQFELKPDGWLAVTPLPVEERHGRMLEVNAEIFRDSLAHKWELSPTRLQYLEKTLAFFQERGRAFLVRMPVSSLMLETESAFMPGFDSLMNAVAERRQLPYFNYATALPDTCFNDGHHLAQPHGRLFSHRLARDVRYWLQEQSKTADDRIR